MGARLARQKRVSDEEIVTATLKLVAKHGPGLTLAQVGDEVGLSAATVMQRFGSKRGLLLEASHAWGKRTIADFQRGGHAGDDIVTGMTEIAGLAETPAEVANLTASMHMDLADPEFRVIIEAEIQRQRSLVRDMLDVGVSRGEIKPCDSAELARHLQVVALGALQSWSIEPTGALTEWVHKCLTETLAPWRLAPTVATAQR
jgi:AcrR family transcriptional regulator